MRGAPLTQTGIAALCYGAFALPVWWVTASPQPSAVPSAIATARAVDPTAAQPPRRLSLTLELAHPAVRVEFLDGPVLLEAVDRPDLVLRWSGAPTNRLVVRAVFDTTTPRTALRIRSGTTDRTLWGRGEIMGAIEP